MKNLLLLLAASGILLAGCKQFKIQPDKIGNRYDMLAAHPWKLVKLEEAGSNVTLKDCQLDDTYVFVHEGWGYMDEGATKCGVPTPVDTTTPVDTSIIVGKSTVPNADNLQYDESGMRINFNWTVVGDQRRILLSDYGSADNDPEWIVEEMDANFLRVRGAETRNGEVITYHKEFVTAP
jgi:hypothetical protein